VLDLEIVVDDRRRELEAAVRGRDQAVAHLLNLLRSVLAENGEGNDTP
jgi:hypothetical protein